MCTIDDTLVAIQAKITAEAHELQEVRRLLGELRGKAGRDGLDIGSQKELIIGIHLLAFIRRLACGEHLPDISEEMFLEISPASAALSKELLSLCELPPGRELDRAEVFYLAVHFEAVRQQT
ncbi:hypothetical protein [Paenibacillus sp. TH7-28]